LVTVQSQLRNRYGAQQYLLHEVFGIMMRKIHVSNHNVDVAGVRIRKIRPGVRFLLVLKRSMRVLRVSMGVGAKDSDTTVSLHCICLSLHASFSRPR
jgi:hypothetical protein